jgi:hypothetical protein
MTFYTQAFESSSALADFVNTQGIAQANIAAILPKDYTWVLFWWA